MRTAALLLVGTILSINVQAQLEKGVIDKVIAVVGDKIILQSDISNAIEDAKRMGNPLPEGAECMLIEQSMSSKILALQAEKDSLIVTDEEVEARVNFYIESFVKGPSELEIDVYKLKESLRKSVRERMLIDAMQEKILRYVNITPSEVQAFYDRIPRDSLPIVDFDSESRNAARHPMNLKDDYVKVADLALQEKRAQTFDRWFRTNISKFYVEVDNDTQEKCADIKKYITYSSKN